MRVNLTDGVSCEFPDADRVGVEGLFVVLRGVPTPTYPMGLVVAQYPRSEVRSVDVDTSVESKTADSYENQGGRP